MIQQLSFNIKLPVVLGLSQLEEIEPKQDQSCSLDFKITLKLGKKLTQQNNHTQCFHLSPKNIEVENKHITLSCFEINNFKRCHQICVDFTNSIQQCKNCFSLIPQLSCSFHKNSLTIKIKRNSMNLSFIMIKKVRFINNKQLKNAMETKEGDWGMVSMDQIGRILLDGKKSNFPVIGIWEKSDKQIEHISTYLKIVQYLNTIYAAKCQFHHQNKNYIYHVRINSNQSIPILYLLHYQIDQAILVQQTYQIKKNPQITIICEPTLPGQSGMQFTLRDKDKQKRDIKTVDQTISYLSPIKYLENDMLDQDNYINKHSPSFNTNQREQKTQDYQLNQFTGLKELLRFQQAQINFLKGEVNRLQSELKFAQTYKLASPPLNGQKYMLTHETNLSSAKLIRKLAESDLKTNSASTKGKSSQGSECIPKIISKCLIQEEEEEKDPWDYLQIIQE